MKKLVQGIIDFRNNIRPSYREAFARLALGQRPDTLFIACSDSRVVPNLFASTDPGDLFVVRNVGNLVPACGGAHGLSVADESEAAAVEFAVLNLGVKDVIICGHSECGAMQALLGDREKVKWPNLREWLRHGEQAVERLRDEPRIPTAEKKPPAALAPHNRLSQLNVLQQVDNLKSYPLIQERIQAGELRIHAWWFELTDALVYHYDAEAGAFVEIDEKQAARIQKGLK